MLFFNSHTHFSKHSSSEILQGIENEPTKCFHSLGIHPWNAAEITDEQLKNLSKNAQFIHCLAIGEIGLDKLKGPPLEIQQTALIQQIAIAEALQLPIIIHCVKAWNELKSIRKSTKHSQPWIYHGFVQSAIVKEVIDQGMLISLGAAIINHPKNLEIVSSIPYNRLLIETDDSEISIIDVYTCIAELKKISLQELTEIVEQNFKKTFRKWHNGLNEQH